MALVYLIPSLLAEDGQAAIPASVLQAIKECQVFFVENERTTRRYFKSIWREMVIDEYEWYLIGEDAGPVFTGKLRENKTIGIVSEAGCPGVADPGQGLVAIAQQSGTAVRPLTGPNSILLALMASGMNGQQFQFVGYLPIDAIQRTKAIRDLEAASAKLNSTQIFIETPYRNNQLLEALLKTCQESTRICIAVDITGKKEWIKTKTAGDWEKNKPDIHKRPAIFLLYSGI